jgi:radical SAM/Cys-rich protein
MAPGPFAGNSATNFHSIDFTVHDHNDPLHRQHLEPGARPMVGPLCCSPEWLSASSCPLTCSTTSRLFPPLQRRRLHTLQVNLGYRCNQSCSHCHVNAGPWRTEAMAEAQIEQVLGVLAHPTIETLDLTGGAPELHPRFRSLVGRARALGRKVIDRCNLTILLEPGQEDLAAFLADQAVHVVASLPCTEAERVNQQRGDGVFERSIEALHRLNHLGYGDPNGPLRLDLVYNPSGANLPPVQASLEAHYREALAREYGLRFNRLLTITNMPIERFARDLAHRGALEAYLEQLQQAHRAENLEAVMCRGLISVNWKGELFDCDFNQQLGLPLGGRHRHLSDLLDQVGDLEGESIRVATHCFGCTAGHGSSCGGALS